MDKKQQLFTIAWGTTAFATLLAFVAWSQSFDWRYSAVSSYLLFPLFGLIAFGLMWSHYISSVARQIMQIEKSSLRNYFEVTSFIVLVAILAHPGLLIVQLFLDGEGLPPASYIEFVAPTLKWAVAIGSISLLLFLAYELRRLYDKKPWWKYVSYGTDLAMILIFIHGLNLGARLQSGWFLYVWYVYGATLAACLAYIHIPAVREHVKNLR